MAEQSKKFLIIDGNAIVHRAYHALPPLTTKKGELVNAVYGFCLIFFKALKEVEPEFVAAAFDLAEPTFRHKQFKEYKAKRKKAPDELYAQLDGVKDILRAFDIPIFEKKGFEADDLIGALALQAKQKQVLPKIENIILTGDMDGLQLVDSQTKVFTMRKGIKDTVLYDTIKTKEKYGGLLPKQLVDFKALRGDPSDNIPGVTGIGEKTAIKLLLDFGSLDNLYKEIEKNSAKAEKIKKGILEKLKQYKDQAMISRKLAEINCNVNIDFKLTDAKFRGYDKQKVVEALTRFEFYTLINKLPGIDVKAADRAGSGVKNENAGRQADVSQQNLFSSKIAHNKEKTDMIEEIHRLKKQGVLSNELAQLEKDLVPIVEQMENRGIMVDKQSLGGLSKKLGKKIKELEKKIFKLSKQQFNLNSPIQMSGILFEELKIPHSAVRKTPGGAISTNAQELEKIAGAHPIIPLILDYRELFKLKSGFVDALPKMIGGDKRIHPDFHQIGAETGRMSCSNPNLQNIPIRSELGREIRKCFVAEKGFVFVSADYSQMELRMIAFIAKDKKMLEYFKQGKDIHIMTAAGIFGIKEKEVSKQQRHLAKTLNYGALYGMGPHKFAQAAGISYQEAKEFIALYFANFSGIANYVEDSIASAEKQGFSQTLFGRRRYLPELNSRDSRLRAQAERIARNFPAQGGTADIMKMVMNKIKQKGLLNNDCRMLLQIHDELLFEVKREKAEQYAKQVKDIMETVSEIKLPLVVELKTGNNWGELKTMVK